MALLAKSGLKAISARPAQRVSRLQLLQQLANAWLPSLSSPCPLDPALLPHRAVCCHLPATAPLPPPRPARRPRPCRATQAAVVPRAAVEFYGPDRAKWLGECADAIAACLLRESDIVRRPRWPLRTCVALRAQCAARVARILPGAVLGAPRS